MPQQEQTVPALGKDLVGLEELTREQITAILVDRGGRELPIQADVVGERVEVPEGGRVEVKVPELDGELGVEVVEAA